MGFDFDCVLCSLLMFHSILHSSTLPLILTLSHIFAHTRTYACTHTHTYTCTHIPKSGPYVTFVLHLMMVSRTKRHVIVLRTMSFKRGSLRTLCRLCLFPLRPHLLVFVNQMNNRVRASHQTSTTRMEIRVAERQRMSEREWENIVLD